MSPCFTPLIYSFALTGSLLPLTGQSTLIYSLLYTLLYIDGISLGARFLPPLLYTMMVAIWRRRKCVRFIEQGCGGVGRKRTLVYIYTLLYSKKNTLCPHIFHPSMFPHLWYVAQEVLAVLSLLGKRGLSLGAKYWRWQGRLCGAR